VVTVKNRPTLISQISRSSFRTYPRLADISTFPFLHHLILPDTPLPILTDSLGIWLSGTVAMGYPHEVTHQSILMPEDIGCRPPQQIPNLPTHTSGGPGYLQATPSYSTSSSYLKLKPASRLGQLGIPPNPIDHWQEGR
jgi:hypothetical protein